MSNEFCVLGFTRSESHLDESGFGFLEMMEDFDDQSFTASNPIEDQPEPLSGTLDPSLPKILPDHLENGDGTIIVSPALKDFLGQEIADIEFFPLHIFKGETLHSDQYYVAHLLNRVDAIDMEAADPAWRGSGKRKRIVRMNDRKLPLLKEKIPASRNLFYLEHFPLISIVRRSFGEALIAAGFTNIALDEIEKALASL